MDNNREASGGSEKALSDEQRKTLKRKRIIAIISLVLAVAIIAGLSVFATKSFLAVGEGETVADAGRHFKDMINGYGAWGVLIAFGIQVLQVVVSPIPGEVIETGMGLAFGWFGGAVICLLGAALSSFLIMLLVRRFGTKFVELFVSLDKINNLKFINSEKKLNRWVLILYMLPGTPKDPLIFFFGLTRIKISTFVVISTLARIPSIVTSTIGGQWIEQKEWVKAIILYVAMGLISLACIFLYKVIIGKMNGHGKKGSAKEREIDEGERRKEDVNGDNGTEGLQIEVESAPDASGDKEG